MDLKVIREDLQALQAHREFVITAVARSGYALSNASAELQADREVVMTAVAQYGCALKYASTELQADREVVMTAVAQNGWALHHASRELQGDRDGGHPAADVHAAHVTGDVGDLHRGSGEGRGHHVDVGGSSGNVHDVLCDGRREGRGQGRLGLLEALGLGVVHLAALGEGDLGVDLQRR